MVSPIGKVVFQKTHTLYLVDSHGTISEVAVGVQYGLHGEKFEGQREYSGKHKKEVRVMVGTPLLFMTMEQFYETAFPKNMTLDEKNKCKKRAARTVNILFDLVVLAKRPI
jgi:hypothetical protein